MADTFTSYGTGLSSPAVRASSVVPSDGSDLNTYSRAIYVGTAGDLRVTMVGGDDVTLPSVPAGQVLPIRVRRVWSTGTAASGIVAFW